MFDAIPAFEDAFNTQSDPDQGFAAPTPDASALLAAVGLPAHAIREVLNSRADTGATSE